MQTQGSKDFSRTEKFKFKNPKLAPSHDNMTELLKKIDKKDKKKRFQSQKQKHTGEWKKQILAISIKTINISKKKKKKCDVSEIMYFNYNKKGHFATDYTKPKN